MDRLTTPHPGGIDMLGMPLIGTYDVDVTPGYPAARVKCTLGRYEDTGLSPDEVTSMIAENARLRAELEAANARWEETASDNTGYTLSHIDGSYAVSDPQGYVVCEFLRERAENGGQNERG